MTLLIENNPRAQRGFTLIELLVVIGILATLSVVAIPAYFAFFNSGEAEANAAELSHVQAAMDAMMAENWLEEIAPQDTPIDSFTALPSSDSAPPAPTAESLFPGFLRTSGTKCNYTWDPSGRLSQSACGGGGAPADEPSGAVDVLVNLDLLMDQLAALEAAGVLNHGQTNALMTKLESAVAAYQDGDRDLAMNSLGAFVNQVNAFLNTGILVGEHGDILIDSAVELMEFLDVDG